MNGPEKKVFILALCLFALGFLVKVSPWDPVPRIEEFSYAENVRGAWNDSSRAEPNLSAAKSASVRNSHSRASRKPKIAVRFPLSVNRATVEELCAIKGVGPKLAERIVAYRSSHGRFAGPADLRKVSGIGKKKAESILTFIVFD